MKKTLSKMFWNFYALCYDTLNQFKPYQEMLREIIDRLGLETETGKKILDAGCGTGNIEVLIKKRYPIMDIFALDFSKIMLARAKKKIKDANFYEGNLEKLPFKNNCMDYIITINVLHTLSDSAKTIRELNRVLKHNGRMVIVVLKDNFHLPYILKAHKHKNEPREKWDPKNIFSWFWLVFRTFGLNLTALKFIFIAVFNKIIDKRIEGLNKGKLEQLFFEEGLEIKYSGLIYGDQDLIFVLKKPALWIKKAGSTEELEKIFNLRHKIFINENRLPVENDIDEYDRKSIHFLTMENDKVIGTMRLILITKKEEEFRGLYTLPFKFDFSRSFEISRVAIEQDKRGGISFLKMIKIAHIYCYHHGYEYLCGTMRNELFHFFKKRKWDFDFISEPFLYYGKWEIVAFISSVNKNMEKIIYC